MNYQRQYLIALACSAVISTSATAQRPVLTTWARSFLAVDTPFIALIHVSLIDGTGAPARDDQTYSSAARPDRNRRCKREGRDPSGGKGPLTSAGTA